MRDRIKLDLALQGGGAHGAFTWGVLDRLLDEDWIDFDGVSGASAGAMNGVMLAQGLMCGGRPGAKQTLEKFWRDVATLASGSSPNAAACTLLNGAVPWGEMFGGSIAAPVDLFSAYAAATSQFWAAMSAFISPYQANPLNWNPLLDLVRDMVDFESLKNSQAPRLFVSATRVADGQVALFRNADLSAEAVMASACLPDLFQAVEIAGTAYWDGGFVANPALEPLVAETQADDLLLIQLNPTSVRKTPRTAPEIAARVNDVTFNANLTLSLHGLAQLKVALDEEPVVLTNPYFRRVQSLRLHRIAADETDFAQETLAKRDARWPYLQRLRNEGASAADAWLRDGQLLGKQSSVDCRLL